MGDSEIINAPDVLMINKRTIVIVLKRAWRAIEFLFLSKHEIARRSSVLRETLNRKEVETERLDRLRNPRDYQGR